MHSARSRREQELRQLVLEGVPLRTQGKSGHWTVGLLHIYTAAGRWFSEKTGRRGRLNGQPMRRMIEIECGDTTLADDPPMESGCPTPSALRRGRQLCPKAAQETKRMTILYQQYEAFMTYAAKHTARYESFMRDARSARCKYKEI